MNTSAQHTSAASPVDPAFVITSGRRGALALLVGASVLLAACGPSKLDTTAGLPPGTTTTTTTTVVTTGPAAASSVASAPALPAATVVVPAPTHSVTKTRPQSSGVAHAGGNSGGGSVESRQVEPAAPRPLGQLGNITAIDAVRSDPEPTNGAGAVIGGLLGGVLGNQVGGGDGKKVATVLGAVGGAVAGNNVQKNRDRTVVGYRLHITLDNGQAEEIIVPNRGAWNNGDRVRVVNGVVRPA